MHQFWERYFDKVLLAALFCYVFTVWVVYGIPEIRDISRDLIIALIALASGRRVQPTTEINAETVRADDLNAASMDQATVNADSINVDNKKGEL